MYKFPRMIYSGHQDRRPSDAPKGGACCAPLRMSCLSGWHRHTTDPTAPPDQPAPESPHRTPAPLVRRHPLHRPRAAQRQRPGPHHRPGSQDHSARTARTCAGLGRPSNDAATAAWWRAPPRRKKDPALVTVVLDIVAPHTAGDPMSGQKWLNCRLSDIREKLKERGHLVSKPIISRLLHASSYSLRTNVKQHAGRKQPERAQQFQHLHAQRAAHQATGQPVISVDTKKKELVGNYKNAGQIWCQTAEVVDDHDFPHDAVGRAVPYGIYDVQHNRGTVYVGQSADTPAFAVDNIAQWCATELRERFPAATQLLIEADSGGSK